MTGCKTNPCLNKSFVTRGRIRAEMQRIITPGDHMAHPMKDNSRFRDIEWEDCTYDGVILGDPHRPSLSQ